MSDPVIIVLISVGLALLVALYAVVMWTARQSARYMMRAVGLVLIIAGAFVTGVTALLLDGARAVVDWVVQKPMDTAAWVGVGLAVLGLLAYLIGGFIKAPTSAEAKQRREERAARERASLASQASQASKAPVPPPLPKPSQPTPKPSEPAGEAAVNPDDEVANILKKHGIE